MISAKPNVELVHRPPPNPNRFNRPGLRPLRQMTAVMVVV